MAVTPVEEQLVRALRAEVRVRDGRPDDGRCGHVADAIREHLGWKKQWGHLLLLDGSVCWVHCWNRTPGGALVDATADQFEERWPGDILVLAPDDPRAKHYRHAPPAWVFRTADAPGSGGVALFARREGDEHEEPRARVESAAARIAGTGLAEPPSPRWSHGISIHAGGSRRHGCCVPGTLAVRRPPPKNSRGSWTWRRTSPRRSSAAGRGSHPSSRSPLAHMRVLDGGSCAQVSM
jgi:hypothetical protein